MGWGSAWGFASLGRFSFSSTSAGMQLHIFFGEDDRAVLFARITPFQKLSAEERKLLQLNSILPAHRKIRTYSKGGSGAVFSCAFKREHTESGILLEPRQSKLRHRCSL